MGKMRWKKNPKEAGLRAVGAGPLGSKLHDGETKFASVSPVGGDYTGPLKGWYFVAGWGSGIPHLNTCNSTLYPDEKSAKAAALKYVREHLK